MANASRAYDSYRLGNSVDAWYFGALGSSAKQHQASRLSAMQPTSSTFAAFLGRLGPQGVTLTDLWRREALVNASRPLPVAGATSARPQFVYPVYSYDTLKLALPEMGSDLRRALVRWAAETRVPWPRYASATHAVVHFRVGDFIHLGQVIRPASVARACASLSPTPTHVEVLDGGSAHEATRADVHESSAMRGALMLALRQQLPQAIMWESAKQPADLDFLRLAGAPQLVTAGGSFGVTAALAASPTTSIRTPACSNLNFCQQSPVEAMQVRPGWDTYAYEV